MQLHDFIFSEEGKYKSIRHLAFWICWWLYFLLVFLLYQQPIPGFRINIYHITPGDHLLAKTFLLLLLFAIACYPLIYYIFPKLITGKWLKALVYLLIICASLIAAVSFLFWSIFPFIDSLWGSNKTNPKMSFYWPAVNLGLMNFAKVAAAAATIKYIKYWWLKQKESQRLQKEKITTELQLLKAQVHPDFLLKTLNNIHTHARSFSPETAGMLLKLSDLLSYMLYDCDGQAVPLEKEIIMMNEYMQLEKIRYNDTPEIQVNTRGDLTEKKIAPFLLLPFIENSFMHCGLMTEQFWINLDIRIEEDLFSMKLTNGIPENSSSHTLLESRTLENVKKRLTLIYPGRHDLKMTIEQEMSIVLLNIRLNPEVGTTQVEEKALPAAKTQKENAVLRYAAD